MAPSEDLFVDARITLRVEAGGGMTLLTLDVSPEARASYAQPGQYVRLGFAGEQGYFVLAGSPEDSTWQILLRAGGVADALLEAESGTEVRVSLAHGHGFPNVAARGRPLWVVVAGTGAAAARAVIPRRIAEGDAALTELFLGFRTLADVPLRDEISAWQAAGVRATICLSRPGDPHEAFVGATPIRHGYVPDVLLAGGRSHGGLVFVVGPPGLVSGTLHAAKALGVRTEDVHTNV